MWVVVHVLLLVALSLACVRVARVAVEHLALLAVCAVALLAASAAAILADAHLSHYQRATQPRAVRQARLCAKTPLLTVAGFPPKEGRVEDGADASLPDYRALTLQLQHCVVTRREFRSAVGRSGPAGLPEVSVHSGLPSADEVRAGGGVVALFCGGSWHGLFRQPRFNRLSFGGLHQVVLGFRAAGLLELPFPVVAFDFPGGLEWLNCGQADDCAVLDHVYQKIVSAHPGVKILILAECLGALRALNWLGTGPRNTENIAAFALESPLQKLDTFLADTSNNERFRTFSFRTLEAILPNYSATRGKAFAYTSKGAELFPSVPLFVGQIEDDAVSGAQELAAVRRCFPDSRTVHFIARGEYVAGLPLRHAQLARCAAYRAALLAFVRAVGLAPQAPGAPDFAAVAPLVPQMAHQGPLAAGAWRPARSACAELPPLPKPRPAARSPAAAVQTRPTASDKRPQPADATGRSEPAAFVDLPPSSPASEPRSPTTSSP